MTSESAITKLICANDGSIDIAELPIKEIIANRERFALVYNGGQKVVAKTNLRLCKAKDCHGCRNLHLCKRFLFGDCHFARGRRGCHFCHDLNSEHNTKILGEHGLEELARSELCTLLLQNDTSLLPPVCHDYNNGFGQYGRCQEGSNCRRLHICENYLRGTCDCPRAHDFYEPHPLQVLQDRAVPTLLMVSMRSVYMNKVLLRDHDRTNKSNYQQQQRAFSANDIPAAATSDGPGPSRRPRPKESSEGGKDKTEICMYYIKGHCKHGDDRCFKAHCNLPYSWEIKEGQQWTALPNNEEIEKDYCDPKKTHSRGIEPVCFDTMTCGLKKVRRLSTVSSVLQPTFVLTTEWAWFWEDEFGNCIKYASATGTHRMATITSADLEQKFQDDNSAVLEFTAGSQSYTLSFLDMIQTNKQFGTKRLVRRRPVFVSSADAQTIKRSKKPMGSQLNFKALPGHWDMSLTPDTGFKRVVLDSSSVEYKEIEELFRNTMRGFDILQIERIQNKALWEVYQWQKDLMKKTNGGRIVSEKKLFHGTDSKYIDAICLNNFDWRICGTHGTAYGKGSYFARDAKYSHSYTGQSNVKSMIVSRILVGDYTSGSSSYLRPPSKDGGDTLFYDSCVDNVRSPSIFVVFEKHQIYPEYLIKYEEETNWSQQWYQQQWYGTALAASSAPPAPRPAPTPRQVPPTAPAPQPTPPSAPQQSQSSNRETCVIS